MKGDIALEFEGLKRSVVVVSTLNHNGHTISTRLEVLNWAPHLDPPNSGGSTCWWDCTWRKFCKKNIVIVCGIAKQFEAEMDFTRNPPMLLLAETNRSVSIALLDND